MSTTTHLNGRLCNQIIRNLAVSILAEKFNLFVDYSSKSLIEELGIRLFVGEKKYLSTIELHNDNYFSIYNNDECNSNLDANAAYFQTKEITNFLCSYLHNEKIRDNIIYNNPFKSRYNANNDVCIHIRLTDVQHHNPGFSYYMNALKNIVFDKLYIATDNPTHVIVKNIKASYPDTTILEYAEVKTLQFASTCKHIILSHGSFSAVIGYLAFFSTIYYPEYGKRKIWYGDMFSIPGWNQINF
jgi:hypothetical protein